MDEHERRMRNLLIKVLAELREQRQHNVLIYSRNYAGTVPREGMEAEHEAARKALAEVNTLIEYYTPDDAEE